MANNLAYANLGFEFFGFLGGSKEKKPPKAPKLHLRGYGNDLMGNL